MIAVLLNPVTSGIHRSSAERGLVQMPGDSASWLLIDLRG
jgi:hypothetical protein